MLLGDTLVFLAPMALEQELGSAACGRGFGCQGPGYPTKLLCDPEQLSPPLWTSVFSRHKVQTQAEASRPAHLYLRHTEPGTAFC